jgi:hypothetical protein
VSKPNPIFAPYGGDMTRGRHVSGFGSRMNGRGGAPRHPPYPFEGIAFNIDVIGFAFDFLIVYIP